MNESREMTDQEIIDDLFTYHKPTEAQAKMYDEINAAAKHFALVVHQLCPPCPDRTAAMRKIREARMTANSSIATKSGGLYR